ncbi:MAG: LptF/LptG family permease, partial [Cyclobacteriaceae bacterium]
TVGAFYVNNYLVPKAALEAYSLLYDIKQKKPALDLREGAFYSSIPDISIKVNDKLPDGQSLRDIIIYDHRGRIGNREVTVADSGKMYTILNDQYLKLELFSGYNYNEGSPQGKDALGRSQAGLTLSKTKFDKTQIVFDLSSFGLNRTDKKWFQGNRIMRNLNQLQHDMDSIDSKIMDQHLNLFTATSNQMFAYAFKRDTVAIPERLSKAKERLDSLNNLEKESMIKEVQSKAGPLAVKPKTLPQKTESDSVKALIAMRSDSLFNSKLVRTELSAALSQIRTMKSQLANYNNQVTTFGFDFRIFQIQWHKILANSLACIVMFLIGAPLGAIIKRGGLGVPVLASITFFIVYYILSMMGDKWARQGVIPVPAGIWAADLILFVVGLLFLRQARADARLFEADFYSVAWDKTLTWLRQKKLISQPID